MGSATTNQPELGLKLVAVCPARAVTGGPEAIHQLVHTANRLQPGSAAILYVPFTTESTVHEYRHYQCPVISRHEVPEDVLVVLPEVWPDLASTFNNRCALWWLSVGNFGSHGQKNLKGIDLHLCQSKYAYDHVKNVLSFEPTMLTDWVDVVKVDTTRLPRVAVNPAKDAGMLRYFINSNKFDVVELRGMNKLEVSTALHSSQIYVDFGNHPGRDRLPREASLAGCTVLSTYLGSACFWEDMPLPNHFKFTYFDELIDMVRKELANLDGRSKAQLGYESWVLDNQKNFEREVDSLLGSLK
jgi:hypothetical protein